jgi:ABC-type polysaccharide/polyol phosphate export permease
MTLPVSTTEDDYYDYDSARRGSRVLHELREVWRYRDFAWQLTARNLRIRYQNSLIGVGWTVLSPLLMTAVLSLVFMTLFRQAAPDYPAYLLSGLLIWNFFIQSTSTMAAEMVTGSGLWKRVYTPKSIYALATLATGTTHLLLAMVPLLALMLFLSIPIGSAAPTALAALPCVMLFTLGVGLFLAGLATRFRDIIDLYQVASSAWLYLTPVIYPRSIVPDRFQWLLALNPMTWCIEAFRLPLLENSVPPVTVLALAGAAGVAMTLLGGWVFTHMTHDLAIRS